MRRFLSLLLLPLLSVSASLGCRDETHRGSYAPVDLFTEGAGERRFRSERFDTLWTYGQSDTVLASPSRIASLASGDVILLDVRFQRIHRVGPSGRLWSWGTTGQGPQEINNVRALTVNNHNEVVLVDSGNRRLIWLSDTGDWIREVPFSPDVQENLLVDGVVSLEDGRYVLNHRTAAPWTILSGGGEFSDRLASPWSGFQEMHPLQTLGEIATGIRSNWAFGFRLGNGFFVFEGDTLAGIHPYVQHVTFPALVATDYAEAGFMLSYVRRPASVAHAMAIHHDTLLVLTTPSWIDRYHLGTGAYHGTTVLPFPSVGVAALGDTLLFIDSSGILPGVTALEIHGDEDE